MHSGDGWRDEHRTQGRPETGQDAKPASGRAAIAMAAVRRGLSVEPSKITDRSDIRPPTDATQSRPYLIPPAKHPVSGFPSSALSRHLPPATCHPKRPLSSARSVLTHYPIILPSPPRHRYSCMTPFPSVIHVRHPFLAFASF